MVNASDPTAIPYIIQENGYYYVAYKAFDPSKGYVSVSAKGVVNGLSTVFNDGADFGPDTYNPDYSGSGIPYTQTSGIQEAIDYLPSVYSTGGDVRLLGNFFGITKGIVIQSPNVALVGEVSQGGSSIGVLSGSVSAVIKSTAFHTSIVNVSVHGTTVLFPGTVATGIDFSQSSAIATNNIIDGVFFNGTFTSYILNMDNNDASIVRNTQLGNSTSASAMFTWKAPGGAKATIIHCSTGTMEVAVQNLLIVGSYMSGINVTENSTPPMVIQIVGCYQDSQTEMINVSSGVTVAYLSYSGYFQIQNGGYVLRGSGIIDKMSINGIAFQVVSGSLPLGWAESTLVVNDYPYIIGSFSGQSGETSIAGAPFNISSAGLLTSGTPSITPNPPVSGTAYQNTNPYDILIYLPVYTSTSGTAGNIKASIGPTSTPATQVVNDIVNSGTTSSNPRTIQLKVPAGWWYEFTGTTTTFGTAVVVAD